MKPAFRSFGSQPPPNGELGGHLLLGKFDDSRAQVESPAMSQGFSQRAELGMSGLPARTGQQHNLLLSQSQPLTSQGLNARPLSSGSTFCPTASQPALSGVFRPNSAPSQPPTAGQLNHMPGAGSPWQQSSQNHCADSGLQLGSGRPRPLFPKKQLSVLGKPSPSSSSLQLARPNSAPTLQHGPGLRGPGGSLMVDMGPAGSLAGPSSRFAPAATQGGFRATGNRSLLPLESQQDDEAYLASQQQQYGSQQHQMQQQQQPGSQLLHTQGSAGMDWENPSGNRQAQGTPMTQQGLGASTAGSSMLAAGRAGQQQRMGPSTASLEASQATMVTDPTQQHPPHDPAAHQNHQGPAASKPASTEAMLTADAHAGPVAAPAGAMQTPRVPLKDPAHAAGGAADLAALASTPAAPCAPQAGAAGGNTAAAAAELTPQQQQLLSRITSLEEHCCSMKDIVNRDIPLLLQQQAESSKQLQELTAAASTNSDSNSTLQAQLQNLTTSVASFMAEFKHWQEQHAAHSTTVLSHAECQTTPGLAAGAQDESRAQQSTGSDSLPATTVGAAAAVAAAPDFSKPAGRGRTASQPKQTSSGKQSSLRSGSLMDLLFSQPQPAAAVSTERAWLPAHEPRAVLSPSGARYQRSKSTPAAAQDGHAAHGLQLGAAGAGHSPFAVGMLAAAPAGRKTGTAPVSAGAKQQQGSLSSPAQPAAAAAEAATTYEPTTKPSQAKGKAAGAGRKGRGKKAATAKLQEDDTSDPPAPAAAARDSRRQSARAAASAAAPAPRPSRQSARVQKAQQQKGSSGGLTQSKLPFQRTTRTVAAAAAAVGVSLSTESAPGCEEATADVQQPPEAAAGAGEADAEPSLKRQRVSSAVNNVAAEGTGARPEADRLGVAAAGRWLLGDPQQLAEEEQQQQQPLVSFSRQNKQSQQQQPAAIATLAASNPAVRTSNGAVPAAVQQAGAFVNKAFAQQSQRPSAGSKPPSAPSGMAAGLKGAAALGRAAPAAASGAGQQSVRRSSLIAAMNAVTGGKRDRSGNVLATTAAATAGAATHPAASSGLREGQTEISSRRASASAAAGAYRLHAAATSSAAMLFGDVDDDGDSLDNVEQQRKDAGRSATVPSAAAAAAGKGPRGGLLARAAGLPVPPANAAKAQPPPPAAAAAGAGLGFRGQYPPGLPPMAPSGLPPHPAVSAAARYEFEADSGDDDDSDTEHSLDQLPRHGPQQQQQRLVNDDELAQQIAARMARHRSKQRRAMSWQGGSAVGGGQSGYSVGVGLR